MTRHSKKATQAAKARAAAQAAARSPRSNRLRQARSVATSTTSLELRQSQTATEAAEETIGAAIECTIDPLQLARQNGPVMVRHFHSSISTLTDPQ